MTEESTGNGDDKGKQYSAFVEAELKAALERRNLAISRSQTALTSATGLVTLVLAVAAVFLGKDPTFSGCAKFFVCMAAIALLAAATCAVLGAIPRKYDAVDDETLRKMAGGQYWEDDDEEEARKTVAEANAQARISMDKRTATANRFLIAAGICQIVAVAALGGCIISVAFAPRPQQPSPTPCCLVPGPPGPPGPVGPPGPPGLCVVTFPYLPGQKN